MATPSSGAISLSSLNTELGYGATVQRSLNDAYVRTLFGLAASGAISLSQGYSKSQVVTSVSFMAGTDLDGRKYALFNYGTNISFTVNAGKKSIDYIVCGGGGAGGSAGGGGGAGGQVVSGTADFTGKHNVVVGSGGSAINNNPITDIPTAGSASQIIASTGGNQNITAAGGGRGGTRYSATATPTYRNGENGGGAASYTGALGTAGPNGTTGGNGILYYGGGGAGAGGNGGNGGVAAVINGGTQNAILGGSASNSAIFTNWLRGGSLYQSYRLGRGGGGSGYASSTVGYGWEGTGVDIYGNGGAGRQQPPNNQTYYYGSAGNESIGMPYTGTSTSSIYTFDFAGTGGGGGAYSTANGTVNTTWRGGGDGSRGCVLLRWT